MSTDNTSKLNQLLTSQPSGIVLQSFWLKELGYSQELQRRYRKSKWFETIGSGAMKRAGDLLTYEGGLYALQRQSNMTVHAGGKTALSFQGLSHYLEFSPQQITVFGGKTENLPLWFKKYDWGAKVNYYRTSFLPPEMGLIEKEFQSFTIKISNPSRALMECLYLVPGKQDMVECFHLMEGLNNLRPAVVQGLLEKCESIKVKRLFLYLAEKANHDWFKKLEPAKIDLGKGKRSIVKQGAYNSTYLITVPKELEENDQRRI
jgi:hypothetical protein